MTWETAMSLELRSIEPARRPKGNLWEVRDEFPDRLSATRMFWQEVGLGPGKRGYRTSLTMSALSNSF